MESNTWFSQVLQIEVDKAARDRSIIPYINPNPVPFTRLSTSAPFIDNSMSQQEATQKAESFLTVKVESIDEKSHINRTKYLP